jgi:hypothetical protein
MWNNIKMYCGEIWCDVVCCIQLSWDRAKCPAGLNLVKNLEASDSVKFGEILY